MAGALKLEDFDRTPPRPRVATAPPLLAPPGRGAPAGPATATATGPAPGPDAFEAGYRAGWDDAVRAAAEDEARVRADLARNLRDLGFTYREARAQVMASLEPLLRDVTERLLPDLARAALAPRVVEMLLAMAQGAAETPVELVIAPGARAAVDRLLSPAPGLPLVVREEPTLDIGQAVLRHGITETRLDLTAVTEAARSGIAALYALTEPPEEERRRA
jgi:flagellar assembly protein FliH